MQFHPLAYIVKLKIEMSMANLIAKIARAQERGAEFDFSGSSHNYLDPTANVVILTGRRPTNPDESAHIAWVAATTERQMNNLKIPDVLDDPKELPDR